MGTAFKVVVAFCIGLGALYAAQRMWLGYVMAQIAAQPAVPISQIVKYEPIKTVDPKAMQKAMGISGPIDTKTGQRLAVESAARRIDLMNRAAQNAVPLPPRIPGFRH
jgi:hypothetical protein